MTLKLALYLLPKFSTVSFAIVLISGISTMVNDSVLNFGKRYRGPPLTRKSLTRFPLPRFLAYVRVSGGISVSRGLQYSPTNTNFM